MERRIVVTTDAGHATLVLTREQILGFRRRVGALDARLPAGADSLRQAAWAGLQDSMPRAALLSIHARVEDAGHDVWADPSLVQVWGPRYQVYVVAAQDVAVFTVGRMPDDAKGRKRAEDTADALHAYLDGRRMPDREADLGLVSVHNSLRRAAPTGRVLIRWEGARAPVVWTVPRPDIEPAEARRELARRYLHVYGPSTATAFSTWAGIAKPEAAAAFEALRPALTAVSTPIGDAWILTSDEAGFRADPGPAARVRLLPSGDAYWLLQGDDRALLVPDADRRGQLWTPRVWPGAVLLDGEIRGTWRRAQHKVTIQAWGDFSKADRQIVEAEAATMPLPSLDGPITVRWE